MRFILYRLVLTEKTSAARAISAALNVTDNKGGFFIGNNHIITWATGHLLELAPPEAYGEQYAKWRYSDLPIIPKVWKYTPLKGKEKQSKIITDLMNRKDVDCVINACDAGREGQLIFQLIYNHAKCTKKTYRFWVSSMESAALKAGFDNLKGNADYDNLYTAALCRKRADWVVGCSSTRLFSVLYGATLNVGRVQSPTLAMLVKREAEIGDFVKEPFYTPVIDCGEFTAHGEK
jgi:DNA topoisomerase-3